MAIGDNLSRYESIFGDVDIQDGPENTIPLNFGGQTGQA
jgi:hypothetical protein